MIKNIRGCRPVSLLALFFHVAAPAGLASEPEDALLMPEEFGAFVVPLEELEEIRGREGTTVMEQMNRSDQRAWLEQNKLQSHMTGSNSIHEDALRVEGIATVIQNTGNQVIIQDTTLINLSISP